MSLYTESSIRSKHGKVRRISVTKLLSDAEEAMSTGWHMGNYYSGKDPWAHIVKNLDADADWIEQPVSSVKNERVDFALSGFRSGTRLIVTGTLNDHTLTVMWSNPTVGHYGEQHWFSTLARAKGVCELSGDAIHRGDAVFRPRSSSPPPLNYKAMILARHLVQAAMHSGSPSTEQPPMTWDRLGSPNVEESVN